MDVATLLTAFATIFLAELPDKTMLATIVLSARFRRPFAVWCGAALALTAQMVIATTAGRLLSLLPDRAVGFGVATLFAIGAMVLWRSRDDGGEGAAGDGRFVGNDQITGEAAATGTTSALRDAAIPASKITATVFGIVFVAEWGDLTQITTASLAARGEALSVFVGATVAMISVAAIGVVAGRTLLRVVPAGILHRIAAAVFATLAVWFLIGAIRN